jgi:PrpF protein
MLRLVLERAVRQRRPGDRRPAIEFRIGPVVAILEHVRLQLRGPVDDVPRIVAIPVSRRDPAFVLHPREQARAGIGRLDMEGRRRDAVLDRPVDGAGKDIGIIVVHAEDEAAVDHDSDAMQPLGHRLVVASQILQLVAAPEVIRRQGLESDEDAAQPRLRGALEEVAAQNGIDCRRALEQSVHATHPGEQGAGKAPVAKQVIIEEIEVTAGEPGDFCKRVVDPLGIEGPAAFEFVAGPLDALTLSGESIAAGEVDLTGRVISNGQPHRALPLAASLCMAVAARLEGSVVHGMTRKTNDCEAPIRIAMPSGVLTVAATVKRSAGEWVAEQGAFYRTQRHLFDGHVYANFARIADLNR